MLMPLSPRCFTPRGLPAPPVVLQPPRSRLVPVELSSAVRLSDTVPRKHIGRPWQRVRLRTHGGFGSLCRVSRALGFRHRKRRLPDLGASKPDPASDGKMNLESAHTGTRTRIIRTHAVADPQRHGVSAAFTAGSGFQAGAFSESSSIDGICADSRGGHLRQVARSPCLLREVSRGTPRRRLPR